MEIWWSAGSKNGRLVDEQPPGLFAEHTDKFIVDGDDMDYNTDAVSDMWFKKQIIVAQGELSFAKEFGPIFERCNARQRQHSVTWVMFMSSTLEAPVFMGKKYSENWHSIKNTGKD